MRLSVRVFTLLQSFISSSVVVLLFFAFFFPSVAFAQTQSIETPSSQTNEYIAPNTDADVPKNQHTFVQSLFIEVLSTVVCQISGIDPVNPKVPCLGINSETNKIGYVSAPTNDPNSPPVGGALGLVSSSIGGLYTPSVSTADYNRYLANNFGIVKTANAQTPEPGYGFAGLAPVLKIWTVIRNIAYFLLILGFIFIGLGIMLRVKIDPRTVMTIQNQIPRIIVCILLITFSYSIAALMVDVMWVTTYAGINALTSAHDPNVAAKVDGQNCQKNGSKLSEAASRFLLQTPITYFNQVFSECQNEGTDVDGGIVAITSGVSLAVGSLAGAVADSLFLDKEENCGLTDPFACVKEAFVNVIDNIAAILVYLVVLCTVLIALFRVWYNLVRAYIFTLIYIIMGPLWIVFGILPQKPLGFEVWLRSLFANLAVFPATAFLFVGARILKDLYTDATPAVTMHGQNVLGAADPGSVLAATDKFIPPLAGHPLAPDFGALIAFGALLTAPALQGLIRDKMKVPNVGSGKIVAAGLMAGAATAAALPRRQISAMTRRNHQTGSGEGLISHSVDKFSEKAMKGMATAANKVPGLRGVGKILGTAAERRENKRQNQGWNSNEEKEAQVSGKSVKDLRKEAKENNLDSKSYIDARQSARIAAQREGRAFTETLEQELESRRSSAKGKPYSVGDLRKDASDANFSTSDYIKQRQSARRQAEEMGGSDEQKEANFNVVLQRNLNAQENGAGKVSIVSAIPEVAKLDDPELASTTPRAHFSQLLAEATGQGVTTDNNVVQRTRNALADKDWANKRIGEMEAEQKQEYINWLSRSTETPAKTDEESA